MFGRLFSNNETTALFYKNIEYKDLIEFIAKTFAIDPDLLETVLYHMSPYVEIGNPVAAANMAAKVKAVAKQQKKKTTKPKKETTKVIKESKAEIGASDDIDFDDMPVVEGSVSAGASYYIKPTFNAKALRAELKKIYRFIDIVEANGVIRIEGLVNSRYQYVFVNSKFISACIPLISIIKNNIDLYYKVNGQNASLYRLMCTFDSMVPSGLTRYKGLGEQDPKELAVSALRPDGDRTLIRYTIESAKEEIESLRRIDSSMASLLREVKITKNEIE